MSILAFNPLDLHLTQSGVRNSDRSLSMASKIRRYLETDLHRAHNLADYWGERVELSTFEDGQTYVRDGTHRLLAVSLVNRWLVETGERPLLLSENDFHITSWRYVDWQRANLRTGWITPFDPRTHVRHANLKEYKAFIRDLSSVLCTHHGVENIWDSELASKQLRSVINESTSMYSTPRTDRHTLESLTEQHVVSWKEHFRIRTWA